MNNNELSNLPGFFYYPSDKSKLMELSFEERCEVIINQGNYAFGMGTQQDPAYRTDLICAMDNALIPTHRNPDAKIPDYGDVPIQLRR